MITAHQLEALSARAAVQQSVKAFLLGEFALKLLGSCSP